VFATVLDLFGYSQWASSIPSSKIVDSKSFISIVQNQSTKSRDWVFAEIFKTTPGTNDGKAMRNATHKLVDLDDGTQRFFNLLKDSLEQNNLISQQFSSDDGQNYSYLCQELAKLTGNNRFCDDHVGSQSLSLQNNIYPNPFETIIHFPQHLVGQKVRVMNAIGLLVFEGQCAPELDLSVLPSGIYQIHFADFAKEKIVLMKKE
jgi:hypothetical protein